MNEFIYLYKMKWRAALGAPFFTVKRREQQQRTEEGEEEE
jgi:hypothetical protein